MCLLGPGNWGFQSEYKNTQYNTEYKLIQELGFTDGSKMRKSYVSFLLINTFDLAELPLENFSPISPVINLYGINKIVKGNFFYSRY